MEWFTSQIGAMVAMSPVVVSETTAQIGRALLIGAIGWAAYELVTTKAELRSLQTQHSVIVVQLGRLESALTTGIDDRWRKRDHDEYAKLLDDRLDLIQQRMDAQGKLIANLVAKK